MDKRFGDIRHLIIDMDGVLYRGSTLLPDTPAFWAWLTGRGMGYQLLTNNSSRTPEQYVAKLAGMGIQVPAERILTSAQATALYLRRLAPAGARVYIIGGAGLTVRQVNEVSKIVGTAARKDAHVFMGAAIDEDTGDDIQVTIVAAEQREKPQTEEPVTPPEAEQQPVAGGRKQRKQKILATQPDLDLMTRRKGRFKDVEPTIFDGEDMDVPTFMRRGIFIEK